MTANSDQTASGDASLAASATETVPPTLFGVEDDAYVFVAVREDPTLGSDSNWLSQTLSVDPNDGARDEFHVDVAERYHVTGRRTDVAFEDRFTVRLAVDPAVSTRGVAPVRRRLDRWYRRTYLDGPRADVAVGTED